MGYHNFSDFILALHEVDKDAAKFLATECIKKKEGMPSLLRDMWNPLHKWERGFNIHNFWYTEKSPQGDEFWRALQKDINRMEKAKADGVWI